MGGRAAGARREHLHRQHADRHGFVSGPYTPLYFAAIAATLKLTPTVYTGGRLITLCAWLVLIALVALLVASAAPRRAGWVAAALAAVGLAVFSPGVIWAVRVKPTIPALALALLGLLIVQRTYRSPRHAYLWALLPFVAAYFTKQTTLAAPAAAVIFLLVHAGWRAAARFVAVGLVVGGIPFALLTLATGGEFFRHIVTDRRLAWQPQLLLNFGGLFLRDSWPLLAAAVVAAVALVLARIPVVAPYFLLTAGLLVITIGVEGADHDHLIELATACALALGSGLAVGLAPRARLLPLAWALLPLLVRNLSPAGRPDRWYDSELRVPDAGRAPPARSDRHRHPQHAGRRAGRGDRADRAGRQAGSLRRPAGDGGAGARGALGSAATARRPERAAVRARHPPGQPARRTLDPGGAGRDRVPTTISSSAMSGSPGRQSGCGRQRECSHRTARRGFLTGAAPSPCLS